MKLRLGRRSETHTATETGPGAVSEVGRDEIVEAAHWLFGTRGWSRVGVEDIAQRVNTTPAEVRRHFPDLVELYVEVYHRLQGELAQGLAARFTSSDPVEMMRQGLRGWLIACERPEVRRILVLDAPVAMGWTRWRAEGDQYGRMLIEACLSEAMDQDILPEPPVRPLGHVIAGSVESAVLYAVHEDRPEAALAEIGAVLEMMLDGIISGARQR